MRSLLITRRRPDQRSHLWAQRLKTRALLATVKSFPDFPVVLETYREAMSDVFDLAGLQEILSQVRARSIDVVEVETRSPSPFARSLVFAYVAAYLYDDDSPVAERKAQALTLDRNLLRELLGQAELRELIDPAALTELEQELAGEAEDRRARDRDELHDLLRRVGDLTEVELAARTAADPAAWLAELEAERRAAPLTVAGERRWIAAEDAGLFCDALGCNPPSGLPGPFLETVTGALEQLVRRYARSHGPFLTHELAERYDLAPGQLEPVLQALEADGLLERGELRPAGVEPEWCDAEILRRLKRRTLAKLRREVAAVDAETLARFLPGWHGVGEGRQGAERLLDAVAQLQGLALPWSSLAQEILPARVADFTLDALDLLAATGRLVWVGRAPLGPRDGKVALYLRESAAELLEPEADYEPPEEVHADVLARLLERCHQPRVVGRLTLARAVCRVDLREVQVLGNDLADEVHEMVRRDQVAEGRGEEVALVHVPAAEDLLAHADRIGRYGGFWPATPKNVGAAVVRQPLRPGRLLRQAASLEFRHS